MGSAPASGAGIRALADASIGRNDSDETTGARHSCRRNMDLPSGKRDFESPILTRELLLGSKTGRECVSADWEPTFLRHECRAPAGAGQDTFGGDSNRSEYRTSSKSLAGATKTTPEAGVIPYAWGRP